MARVVLLACGRLHNTGRLLFTNIESALFTVSARAVPLSLLLAFVAVVGRSDTTHCTALHCTSLHLLFPLASPFSTCPFRPPMTPLLPPQGEYVQCAEATVRRWRWRWSLRWWLCVVASVVAMAIVMDSYSRVESNDLSVCCVGLRAGDGVDQQHRRHCTPRCLFCVDRSLDGGAAPTTRPVLARTVLLVCHHVTPCGTYVRFLCPKHADKLTDIGRGDVRGACCWCCCCWWWWCWWCCCCKVIKAMNTRVDVVGGVVVKLSKQ